MKLPVILLLCLSQVAHARATAQYSRSTNSVKADGSIGKVQTKSEYTRETKAWHGNHTAVLLEDPVYSNVWKDASHKQKKFVCSRNHWMQAYDYTKYSDEMKNSDNCKDKCIDTQDCRAVAWKDKPWNNKKSTCVLFRDCVDDLDKACEGLSNCDDGRDYRKTPAWVYKMDCIDDKFYDDPVYPGGCEGWAQFSCDAAGKLTAEQRVALKKACPFSCKQCLTCSAKANGDKHGSCPKGQSCNEGTCQDDMCSATHQNGKCLEATQYCKGGNCETCADEVGYVDPEYRGEDNYQSCIGWEKFDCSARSYHSGTETKATIDGWVATLRAKCPKACGLCGKCRQECTPTTYCETHLGTGLCTKCEDNALFADPIWTKTGCEAWKDYSCTKHRTESHINILRKNCPKACRICTDSVE